MEKYEQKRATCSHVNHQINVLASNPKHRKKQVYVSAIKPNHSAPTNKSSPCSVPVKKSEPTPLAAKPRVKVYPFGLKPNIKSAETLPSDTGNKRTTKTCSSRAFDCFSIIGKIYTSSAVCSKTRKLYTTTEANQTTRRNSETMAHQTRFRRTTKTYPTLIPHADLGCLLSCTLYRR